MLGEGDRVLIILQTISVLSVRVYQFPFLNFPSLTVSHKATLSKKPHKNKTK